MSPQETGTIALPCALFERFIDQTRCPFHTYTASSWDLVSFPRKRESRRRAHGDWMPAYAGMTFYWYRTYEMDI